MVSPQSAGHCAILSFLKICGTCSLPGVSLDLMFTSAVLYVFCLLAIRFVSLGERVFVSWDRIGALLG